MKKFALFFCCVAACATAMLFRHGENADTSTVEITTGYLYKLGDFGGKIALYEFGCKTPVEIYDIMTDSLPESDERRLLDGIAVSDEGELDRLLEEYLS